MGIKIVNDESCHELKIVNQSVWESLEGGNKRGMM